MGKGVCFNSCQGLKSMQSTRVVYRILYKIFAVLKNIVFEHSCQMSQIICLR